MPVTCYQIADFAEEPGQPVVAVNTFSLPAPSTNLKELLRLVAPTVEELGSTGSVFDPSYRYAVQEADMSAVLALLESHRAPRVTAMTRSGLSVCLDFYQHPDEAGQGWTKTEIGALVYAAKYHGALKQAGPELAKRVTSYVSDHPVMRTAIGVAPVPSSQAVGVAEGGLVAGIAKWVSRELGIPLVHLERVSVTEHPQKNLPRDSDPDANQAETMRADLDGGGLILIIDDLMRDASTVNEAVRALTGAGATGTTSLTLTKERTGTRNYQFS